MADLRNSFDVNVTNGQLPQIQEEATANGMGALRRGWNAGQLGSEANYLAAQELGLRNEGRHAEADGLRAKIAELQQRQQLYAPQVGRVEDIGGVGDAASWAATQMGQGAASMTDPMALAAGVGAAGRVAGMVKNPLAQAFSKAAPYLAGVGAYGVNQRQLTGEIGNEMAADPELMANTTAHQRYVDANTYGAGAAALDTLLPAHIAGKVVGKGTVGAITKRAGLAGELGMEGATELGQEYGSQQVQNQLNPNRDTSGDNSALLNSFAGGVAGAGGPVALGAGAERLHSAASKTVDAVGEKAGDVVDLANGAATAAKDKGKGFLGGAKALFGKTEATDLGGAEKAPSKGPAEAPDGAPAGFRLTPDEMDTLDPNAGGADPSGPEFMDHVMRRADFVKQKLGSLAESHPEAAQLYAQLTNPSSPEAEFDAADRGAILLHQMHDQDALDAKGKAMEQNLKALGSMAGRGVAAVAKGVAKGAATVGKAAWEGATSKKNEQADADHAKASDLAEKFAANVAAEKNDNRSGVVALARHVVRQLTSAGANAGSTNRNAMLNRVAAVVQKTYREDSQKVLDEVSKIMGSKGAQAINYVKREVEALSGPQGRLHERQQRHALADQLIGLVPHEKEAALASQGINIRMGADRDKLLSLMEDYVDGASDPGLRRRLNAVFGHETVNKMVAHLNGVAEQKTVEKPAGSGRVEKIKDSDDIVAKDDDGDGDTFGAQKKFDAGQGDRVYGFHQSSTLRARGTGGNDIFAGTTNSQDGKVTRPKLLKADTMVTGPGGKGKVNGITKKIADIRKQLGDRSAEYAVKSRPVSEVMDDHGVQPAAKMAAFRDYLRQDARDDKSLSDDQRKALLKQAMGAARYVLDSMRKPEDKTAHRLTPGEREELRAAAAKYFSERHVVEAAKMVDGMPDRMELPALMKMAAATRKAIDFARKPGVDGNKVMDENNILTFSRDKKALNVRADDLMKWGRSQRLKQEATDLEDNQSDFSNAARDKQYLTDLMSGISAVMDSGLVDKVLPFKTNAQGGQESFKDGVPPSLRLATTTQKGRESADSKRKTEANVGTAPVQDEDAVAKEQTKERVDGGEADAPMKDDRLSDTNIIKRQAFTAAERDAIAKLPTLKERMAYIAKLRGKEAAENQGEFDKDVALNGTQGAQYNADARRADAKTDRFDKTPLDFFAKQKAGEEKDDFADQRYQSRVEGFDAANIAAPKSAMRARGEVNKDAADITKALTPLPEGKTVVQKGELGRPAEGFAMIESRLRSAARTSKPDASGLTGGIHFIYPVLKVLNGDAIGTYDFNVPEMQKAVALRAQTAQVLLDADITPKQRVALARELLTSVAADRINVSNVKTALTKVAQVAQATATEGRDLGALPMHYKMPPDAVRQDLRPLYPGGTTTAQLMADGHRTATTRRPFGAVGDTFTVNGKKYRITAIEKVDLDSAPGRKKWAEREGWDLGYVQANLSGQVFTGAVQTVFEPTQAAPEVAAQAPKSQSAPAGARVDLGTSGPYTKKDQAKSDQATKFVGRGSDRSSTTKYANAWGDRANTGQYTADDVVFVSAEGNRGGRVAPDFAEIGRAVNARATIVTDDKANREREYNVGEREVAKFLHDSGYREVAPGQWKPGKLNSQGKVVDLGKIRGDRMMARAKDIISQLSGEDFDTLQNDVLSLDPSRRKMPSALKESFREWLREYHPIERESMMAHENLAGTEERFYEEVVDTSDVPLERALAQAMLSGATMSVAPAGARKLNAMSSMSLDDKLTSVLAERGIVVTRDALEGMPTEDRISLVSRTLRADPSQTMAPDVARFVSWMVVGSDFYSRVDAGIAGTQMEKDIMAKVDRDPRQSLYIPTRKRREVVRQAVEQLLTYGLYKRYAQEGTLSQKLVAVVKEAARYAIEALGGVPFRSLQAEADRLVDGILSGEVKLERPRKEGSVLMDPNKAFAEDQHAANIVYGLTEGGGFALTGSLAYAAQGTVYRPAGVPIHDLDLTTNLSQKSAEARLTRLYPQAELVRSFGGLGSFVTTYVVPPKGYTVSDVAAENGAIKGYTVLRDGKVAGRYEHTDKGETQSGVRATVVDLIGDTRKDYASMVIPTAFGDKRVPVSHYRDAMTEKLVYARDKDITDFVNFVPHDRKLNQQNAGPNRVASQAEMDAARAYLKKIAPDVKLAFKDITGYSGEFIEAENAIEISTTSPAGVMEVAYHEALHKFFSQFVKSDPKVFAALSALAENQRLIERVHALLKGYPAAQRQLADGEERLAYIFQFWAAGKLDLPVGRPTTIMQKIRKFFRRVAGMISKEERAADLLHAFHNGELSEPSAAGRVIADIMNQGTFTPKQLRRMDKLVQGAAGLVVPSETILAKSESAAARALAKEFYTNPGDETSAGHGEGLLNATRTTAAKNVNRFAGAIRGLSDRDLTDVTRYMQQGTEVSDIPYAPHREAVKAIRQHLSEFYDYMTDRGMKMGKINEKYFPVSWSLNKLTLEADKFKKMLTDNYADMLDEAVNAAKVPLTRDDVAGRIWQALIDRNGTDGKIDVTRDDGVLAPFFANSEHRELNWIKPEHSEPFLHKNLVSIMTGYIHQGVKAAEYTERFGRDGKLLDDKLTEVHNELKEIALAKLNAQEFDGKQQADDWVEGQMKNIKRATGAMEGSLGKDISPTLRNFNSWMMVYQNLRLLPLTLFASFVDPLGMVARGATMKEAYETFLRGMREVFTGWADMVRDTPKERQADKWELLAEHIGALDAIMLSHHVSEEYSSTYLSGGAKKINDTLFKLNGMEAWNRGVRAGAVRSAVKFIARHSKLPEVHSKRWLDELSLTDDHIALDNDGELILDANELANAKGISVPEAKRRVEALHSAINRWVVGAVLTPNSAQRPAWASDPHYSVFFHLKQFSYSFHQTILKRAVQEMNHGNLAPIGAFAGYIPAMIASDVVKGLIVGGGELPDYMKSYNLGDWVKHGVERSGTLGIAGIGVDASHDIFSLAGPGVEQVMDAMVDPIGQTTLNALPVHGLYAELLK